MAQRRMFSKAITDSGKFLRMEAPVRLLYYDLGMAADDEGIVEAFAVILKTRASEDDLHYLEDKGYIKILNDDLVTYICDWESNNVIRNDRKTPSVHRDLLSNDCVEPEAKDDKTEECQPNDNQMTAEKEAPEIEEKEEHQPNDSQMTTKCQPNVNQMSTKCRNSADKCLSQDRLGKDRLGKDIKEREGEKPSLSPSPCNQVIELYHSICTSYPHVQKLSNARKKELSTRLKSYSLDDFRSLFEKAQSSDFLKGNNERHWSASFDWLIKEANMIKVIEGNYDDKASKPKATASGKNNRFTNFSQREYDFEALERELLETSPTTAAGG